MDKEILLGLTTTSQSDWRQKIADISTFKITKVALFLTGIGQEERKELYKLLEASTVLEIPHIHIRDDVELWEIDYLIERYHTVAINIHPESRYKWRYDYDKYQGMIFLENALIPTAAEMQRYPGLCLDFAHWENRVLRFGGQGDEITATLLEYIKQYPIGCCHISAIKKEPAFVPTVENFGNMYDVHHFDELADFDYMKKYVAYLPKYISLELENSFPQQLEAKKYLEKLLFSE